jgi:tripartite-type tricarboxylate transporter receptor subunit TctC
MNRRTLLATAAFGTAGLALPSLSFAQKKWPERPVRLVVPYPPGGATDVLARLYAEAMTRTLGQPVVIENRPGASGNIGIDAVAKAPADGYTIGAGTVSNFSINQYLYKNVPYDIEKDLTPIALGWEFPNIAVVAPNKVPAKTLAEFIAWAKAKPQGITYGSTGIGTTTHLSSALFFSRIGVEAVHVPYRGASQTIPALLNGDVDFALDVVEAINAALKQAVEDPAQRDRFAKVGAKPIWTTAQQATERAARERPMWQQLVKTSGASAD